MTTDKEQFPPSRKTTGLRRMPLALTALLCVTGLIVFRLTVYDPTRWTYRYHQRELTAIVSQIKAQQIPIGTAREFEVAHSLDPATLSPYKEKEADHDSFDHIRAYRGDQDDYLISIAIDEEGHDGTYGLLYSDLPLKVIPIQDSDGGSIDVGPELQHLDLKEHLSSKWSYVVEEG